MSICLSNTFRHLETLLPATEERARGDSGALFSPKKNLNTSPQDLAQLLAQKQLTGSPSFFLSCFLSLFLFVCSETHIYSFFVALRSLVSFSIAQKSDTLFFFVALRSDPRYKDSWGSPKTPAHAFPSADLQEDAWRQS